MGITLPKRIDGAAPQQLKEGRQITVIGANGAGKTRFSLKLISSFGNRAYVMSAMKAMFPTPAGRKPLEGSIDDLFAKADSASSFVKLDANTELERLTFLLLHDEFIELMKYKSACFDPDTPAGKKAEVPHTKLDVLVSKWEEVFPNNRILRQGGKLLFSSASGNDVYSTLRLSDGEKAILYYLGAAILILCVLYTFAKVKEMPPKEYAEFHGIDPARQEEEKNNEPGLLKLLVHAPRTFWTVGLVQFFCWAAFMYMWTYTNGAVAANCWNTTDPASDGYQAAGNWVGVLFAVQAVGSILWAIVIPKFKSLKLSYVLSLIIGAIGFISVIFIHDKYLLLGSYFLVGAAWAAMLALPFTLLTNSLSGEHLGSYLGLFNCTICLPQIVAAALGGVVLRMVGNSQAGMLVLAGILLLCGSAAVSLIKGKK